MGHIRLRDVNFQPVFQNFDPCFDIDRVADLDRVMQHCWAETYPTVTPDRFLRLHCWLDMLLRNEGPIQHVGLNSLRHLYAALLDAPH